MNHRHDALSYVGGLVHFYKQLYDEDNEQWCFLSLFLFPRLTKLYPAENILSLSSLTLFSNLKVVTEIYFDVLSIVLVQYCCMHICSFLLFEGHWVFRLDKACLNSSFKVASLQSLALPCILTYGNILPSKRYFFWIVFYVTFSCIPFMYSINSLDIRYY